MRYRSRVAKRNANEPVAEVSEQPQQGDQIRGTAQPPTELGSSEFSGENAANLGGDFGVYELEAKKERQNIR